MFIRKYYFKSLILALVTSMILVLSFSTICYGDEMWRQKVSPDSFRYLMEQGNENHYFRTDPSQFSWPDYSYANDQKRPDEKQLGQGKSVEIQLPNQVKWVCNNGAVSVAELTVDFTDEIKKNDENVDKAKKVYVASGTVVSINQDAVVSISNTFDKNKDAVNGRTFVYDRAIAITNGIDLADSTKTTGEIKNRRRLSENENNPPNQNYTAANLNTNVNKNDNKNTNGPENTYVATNSNAVVNSKSETTPKTKEAFPSYSPTPPAKDDYYVAENANVNTNTNSNVTGKEAFPSYSPTPPAKDDYYVAENANVNTNTNSNVTGLPNTRPDAVPNDKNYVVASANTITNTNSNVNTNTNSNATGLPNTRPDAVPNDKNYVVAVANTVTNSNSNINTNTNSNAAGLPNTRPDAAPNDKNYIVASANVNVNQNSNVNTNTNSNANGLPNTNPNGTTNEKNFAAANSNLVTDNASKADTTAIVQSNTIISNSDLEKNLSATNVASKEDQDKAKQGATFISMLTELFTGSKSNELPDTAIKNPTDDPNSKYLASNVSVETTKESETKVDAISNSDKPVVDDSDSLLAAFFKMLAQFLREIIAFFTAYFQGDPIITQLQGSLSN